MKLHRRRILAAVGAVGALVAAALLMLPAQATQPTPAPEVSTTILARSLFDPIQVKARTPAPDRWKAQLKTQGQSDVYVVDNKFPPGASTGWHSHAGPSLILVVTGTVTNDIAAETIAVQLLPKDAARRIPATAPSGCPF